jgi:hypothetical protein
MASREGQGMQIAVILFAILTVILAVTTYIYYAASETKEKERQAAVEAEKVSTSAQHKANYKTAALKYMLGFIKTRKEVDDLKGLTGGGEDTEVNAWLAQYDRDMELYGNASTETDRNYMNLPGYLITTMHSRNASLTNTNKQLIDEQTARTENVKAEQARATAAEEGLKAEQASSLDGRTKYQDQLKVAQKAGADAETKLVETQTKAKKELETAAGEFTALTGSFGNLTRVKESLAAQVKVLESVQGVNIDNPDATIIWINQKQRLVWIDRGFDDGLGRQMSFAVYSQNQASLFNQKTQMRKEGTGMEKVKKLSSKGRIEVVRITGPHQAECRILEDKTSDPILPGDWIHSPAWSPGQRLHFALIGFMDIDGDQQSDRETIKHIITMNGGVIDTEVTDSGERDEGKMTVNTRYVVTGDSSEKGNLAIKNITQYQTTRTKFFEEVDLYGVEKISVQQLMDMMGWKPEEKTVGLGGVMDAGFSKRGPGVKGAPGAPPAGKAPAAEGAPAEVPPADAPPAEAPAEGAPKGKKPAAAADDKDPFGGK